MSEDEERLRNLILFKMYATDKEMGEISLVILVMCLIAGAGYGIWRLI